MPISTGLDILTRWTVEANVGKYTEIKLPRLSNSVECYVEDRDQRDKVTIGTINLGKLPWLLNARRRLWGKINVLYVLGKFQPPL